MTPDPLERIRAYRGQVLNTKAAATAFSYQDVFNLADQLDETRLALAKIVACIETSADDSRAPEAAKGSMMAQVCKVLLNTGQVHEARRLLGRLPAEATS